MLKKLKLKVIILVIEVIIKIMDFKLIKIIIMRKKIIKKGKIVVNKKLSIVKLLIYFILYIYII